MNEKLGIFQEFCISKINLATEFIVDNILSSLGIEINFEFRYKNIKAYILDFIVITEGLLNSSIRYLNKGVFSIDSFANFLAEDFPGVDFDSSFLSFLHGVVSVNIENLLLLESKKIRAFEGLSLSHFTFNIQRTLSHQMSAYLEDKLDVLIKIRRESDSDYEVFEVEEKDLDSLISNLKEIQTKIK